MANYKFITDTGVVIPDTADILAEVESEWRGALGNDLVVTSDTPQGVLISAQTTARVGVVQNNAALANQINPNEAGGVFLDAICAFLGLERTKETFTRVPGVEFRGFPQTLLMAGIRAKSATGHIFATTGAVLLGPDGIGTGDMFAALPGPIPCPVGTLATVVDTVLGWEAVTNPFAGELGAAQQSDASLRALRDETLARQGISTREAQISGLNDPAQVPGLLSAVFRENYTDTDATIDGVFLKKHSVWACVDGGTDIDVANVLLKNKTDGANWNGAITVSVVDPWSGQTYPVKFDRAALIPVFVNITVSRGTDTSDPLTSVPLAIVNYASGEQPGERGLVVGAAVSPFEISAAVNYYHPAMTVRRVDLFLAGDTPTPAEIPMTLKQRGLIALAYVTVTIAS